MYRTNHFNPGDFSVFYFGNAQTQPRKVCTGTCPHLCTILIQLLQQYIQKRVILIRAGNVQLKRRLIWQTFCVARNTVLSVSSKEENRNFLVAKRIAMAITPSRLFTGEEWSMMICLAMANISTSKTVRGVCR